jgi:hypothetical protein
VLRDGFAISRDDIPLLFHSPMNLFRWEKDGVWIQWNDTETVWEGDEANNPNWDYAEADKLERVEVEGVEFFRIHTAPFQFNIDTEQMAELGYGAYFVPGGGIVVNAPDTAPDVAAKCIADELQMDYGTYAPSHLNSWDEYASQVPNLDRVFAFAGVDRHEKEKQAAVAALVDCWIAQRAQDTDSTGTARADELAVGDVLEAVDVRWWSHSPVRVDPSCRAKRYRGSVPAVQASHSFPELIDQIPIPASVRIFPCIGTFPSLSTS